MGTLSIDSMNYADASCQQSNGFIDLFVSGGTAPYSYLWSNNETTEDLNNIPAGLYDVTVTDADGCQTDRQGIVIQNLNYGFGIQQTVITDEQCGSDGSIDVVPTGGAAPYHYTWSNSATTASIENLAGGLYYLTVNEANGCVFIDSFVINAAANPMVISMTSAAPMCNQPNGFIDLSLSGGVPPYTYWWNTTETTEGVFNLAAGMYSVTIEDHNGCVINAAFNLVDTTAWTSLLTVDTTSTSCSSCNDGAIDLTLDISGAPYTFQWNTGATTEDLTGLVAGTYFVTITDVNGCTLDSSFVVSTTVGVEELSSLVHAKVYPNPSDGNFTLEFRNALTEHSQINICNQLGQVIYTKKLEREDGDRKIYLELGHLTSGIYILQWRNKMQHFTQKITVY